jgi:hypothetical protein
MLVKIFPTQTKAKVKIPNPSSEFCQLHQKSRRSPLEARKESLGYLSE